MLNEYILTWLLIYFLFASKFRDGVHLKKTLASAKLKRSLKTNYFTPKKPALSRKVSPRAHGAVLKCLSAFDTPTGMPLGTVNLARGADPYETPVTCTAGVGTFIVEFGALSRLTGNTTYEEKAMKALRSLFSFKSGIGLVSCRWLAACSFAFIILFFVSVSNLIFALFFFAPVSSLFLLRACGFSIFIKPVGSGTLTFSRLPSHDCLEQSTFV